MFTVKAPEAFKATLTIIGHGREQKLNLTYRHFPADQYQSLFKAVGAGETTPVQAVLDIVSDWDADAALDTEGVEFAGQQQVGLLWAILQGYQDAIAVARKGN